TCAALNPPCGAPSGACCFELFGCWTGSQSDCVAAGGTWQGPDSLCGHCPCTVSCPAGATAEGEPTCFDNYVDTFNAGCDATPFHATSVFFGDTICGVSGVFTAAGQFAVDRDWYEIFV